MFDPLLWLYQLRLFVWSLPPCVGGLVIIFGLPALLFGLALWMQGNYTKRKHT